MIANCLCTEFYIVAKVLYYKLLEILYHIPSLVQEYLTMHLNIFTFNDNFCLRSPVSVED